MKIFKAKILLFFVVSTIASAKDFDGDIISDAVYVESPTDTDLDGKLDQIYVTFSRPNTSEKVPTIYTITPYAYGGNQVPFHEVDVAYLPQDNSADKWKLSNKMREFLRSKELLDFAPNNVLQRGYASVQAHSLGTGRSTGCPTVGNMQESIAAKAVIDWLNGRAKAYSSSGREIKATWANGAVGMYGVSYDGTLPNMVAATGVDGLKAIVPIAAISSWYDYYRANGLVVGPGGYIGEDADVLAKFIVRDGGGCNDQIGKIKESMGRENGDFTNFWLDRDYVQYAEQVKAATFIVHGQSDWNVKQKHAIQWWQALDGKVPLRMWLHNGGHGDPDRRDFQDEMWDWFDRYVKGSENGVENKPRVEVQDAAGNWAEQNSWPNEHSSVVTYYINGKNLEGSAPVSPVERVFKDSGKSTKIEDIASNPSSENQAGLVFLSQKLDQSKLLTGTPVVTLNLAVDNRHAANITVVLLEYDANNRAKVITRGWSDLQNHADMSTGEMLEKGKFYQMKFNLEPKQYKISSGSKIGVLVTATDFDYTLRPDVGTILKLSGGGENKIELQLVD